MSAFKVESCFGADINLGYFDIEEILDILQIKDEVVNNKRVKGLIKKHGMKERIVTIAMRQVTLDTVRPVLDAGVLPYDPYFTYTKLLSSKHDRRYDAEERLLLLCLSIAHGRSIRSIKKLHEGINTKDWREKSQRGQSLFRYFRQELNENTRAYIMSYKARQLGNEEAEEKKEGGKELESRIEPALEEPISKIGERRRSGNAMVPSDKVIFTSFDEEVITALKLFQDGHKLLERQIALYKRGEVLEVDSLRSFCQRLLESHNRNSYALLAIRHIKDVSSYLEQHAMGMAVLGIHFAKAMHLSKAYIEAITLGALLMDLGRCRLPLGMVNKASKMTDAEFDLFRKHIQFGEQILLLCKGAPKVAYQMLIDHHEKIDGSGYPNGKQDQEISVYGKMAMIIDAYDAMTSEQPHKHSMGPIRARQQMVKESGLAFDKPLLAVFLKHIGSIPVGSCVSLSNGRVGFVLTLSKDFKPSLIRQVYSLRSKSFIASADIDLDKRANRGDVFIEKEVDPKKLGIQFINHIA